MDMINLICSLVLIGLIWTFAFLETPIIVWTISFGLVLLTFSLLGYLTLATLIIFWLGFIIAAGFANLHVLRQKYIVKPAFAKLQRKMPSISRTEREALEAGNTWWEKELFSGSPRWKDLFSLPKPVLTQEEEQFLNNQVEKLCSLINDWQVIFEKHDLTLEVWDYLKKEKFFGMAIPKEYGGLGFSALAHSTVVIKIATRSLSAAVNTMVPNSLGPGELLLHYGTDEQKKYYLPRLAAGEEIPCFALTAPDAGSDAGAIPDTGIVCKQLLNDQEVLGIKLTWDKRYITLAPVATVLGLAFHLYDPEHLLGEKEDLGITLCLLPTSHPGVEIGNRHFPVYQAFMNGPTRGKDVFIPMDWIIGGPAMAGQGWRMLMECLSIGRSISLPALSTACGKMTYRYTGAYARIRKQFNTAISNFEGIEEALSDIAGKMYLLEATRIMTANAVDLKVKPSIASAITKYHLTEMSRDVVARAMDIHAGHMIQMGPRNFLANAHIAIPISITVEGANILTRNLIIFGQGAIRCHPYLLKEISLLSAEKPDYAQLDRTLLGHVGFFMSNFMRSFAYGLTGGFFIFSRMKPCRIRKYHKQINRMSTMLALFADASLITLGGSLKRRERISARLGDILSYLYMASAVLKYFNDHGRNQADIDYVAWTLQYCLYKISIASREFADNFPNRLLGKFLYFIAFPFGSSYHSPSDKLSHALIANMVTSSELRDRLTQYCYTSNEPDEITFRLDKALDSINEIDPLAKKLHKAIQQGTIPAYLSYEEKLIKAKNTGVLSPEEAKQLSEFERLKNEIIKVNEFSFDLAQVIA